MVEPKCERWLCQKERWVHPEKGRLCLCQEHAEEVFRGEAKAPPLRRGLDYYSGPRKSLVIEQPKEELEMSYRIEPTTVEAFALADEALCLGPDGWLKEPSQISIQGAATVEEALGIIWEGSKGLLGIGEMVFYQVTEFQGFMVFHPAPAGDDDEDA